LFPVFLILTFIIQKITQEILSSTCLKTAFEKLFQEITEALHIRYSFKKYLYLIKVGINSSHNKSLELYLILKRRRCLFVKNWFESVLILLKNERSEF